MNDRKTIAIDFDGVMNKYKGWKGENVLYKPQTGLKRFIKKIYKDYDIVIFTCRDIRKVHIWLDENRLGEYVVAVTNLKPKAFAYIDDRAINFGGDFDEVLKKLEEFEVWWKVE